MKKKPIVLTGVFVIDGKFVSKVHVAAALTATGTEVLKTLPKKGSDAKVAVGSMMGKKKTNGLLLTAGSRGIEAMNFADLVNPRFKSALAKVLRASDNLCTTERAWLETRRKSSKQTEAAA